MTASGTKQNQWTAAEDATLTTLYAQVTAREIGEILGRTRASVKNRTQTLGLVKPGENQGSWLKGGTPWNKGKSYTAGGRSAETQFKKGARPPNVHEVGHVRINSDGYLDIKVAPGKRQWVQLHRHNWKQHYGSYPHPDMAVAFKDGNKHNCDISNLELITRQALMLRNSCHNHGPEIAQIVQLRSAIVRQINKRKAAPHKGISSPISAKGVRA